MGQMIGADPDQLDQLSRQMANAADRLNAIRTSVEAHLLYSTWAGPDSRRFRDEWNGRLHGQLLAVIEAVQRDAASLSANAEQQRQASASPSTFSSMVALAGFGAMISDVKDVRKYAKMLQDVLAAKNGEDAAAAVTVDAAGKVTLGVGAALDGATLLNGIHEHSRSDEISGGVGLLFDGLAAVSLVAAPEVFPAIVLAHTEFEVIDYLSSPDGQAAVADGVRDVAHVEDNIVGAEWHAADVVGSALQRGVRGVLAGL